MERISLTVSEMSFENVDGQRMDGPRMPVYTISSSTSLWSGELKRQNKKDVCGNMVGIRDGTKENTENGKVYS